MEIILLKSVTFFALFLCPIDGKQFKLNVLVTSYEYMTTPRGRLEFTNCRQATIFATEMANNQSVFLPDYDLELDFQHEGSLGHDMPRKVIEYKRKFENKHDGRLEDGSFQSPLSVGPWYSSGCQAVGPLMHHLDQVMISTLCTDSKLANRTKFPNLFLLSSTNSPKLYGYIRFMKEIGKWNKFALLANPDNTNDFNTAMKFYEIASAQGMEMIWFDFINNFNEDSAMKLKESNARIIVIFTSTNDMMVDFYCLAHQVGMKGNRYVFLHPNGGDITSSDNAKLGQCSLEELMSQYERAFLFGQQAGATNVMEETLFGYSRLDFEQAFPKYLEAKSISIIDYGLRHVCHDVVLQIVEILDKSERRLRKMNLSLRNYSQIPEKIMSIVYEEALTVNYTGMSASNIHYGDINEPSGLPYFMEKVKDNGTIEKIYEINKIGGKTYDFQSYQLIQVGNFSWNTTNQKPPSDFWTVKTLNLKLGNWQRIALQVVIALVLTIQVLFLISIGWRKTLVFSRYRQLPKLGLFGIFNSITLAIGALFFTIDVEGDGQIGVWQIRITFICISIVVLFSLPIFTIISFNTKATSKAKQGRLRSNSCSTKRSRNLSANSRSKSPKHEKLLLSPMTFEDFKLAEKDAFMTTSFAIVIIGLVLLLWFVLDPIRCSTLETKQPQYEEKTDILFKSVSIICQSNYQLIWILAISVSIGIFAASALLIALTMKYSKLHQFYPTFPTIVISLLNNFSLVFATWLVMISISNPIDQQIAMACLTLVISLSSSCIYFYGMMAKLSRAI